MLNRLQLFRNIGQFDSVSAGANVPLAPLTVCYAENGRGKTTLAAILRSLSNGDPLYISERHRLGSANQPHVVIDCVGGPPSAMFQNGQWNRTLPDIVVFDDTFVDENVCSGLVVEPGHRQRLHEWILGQQGVALNRAVQQAAADIEECNQNLRTAAEAIPATLRGPFAVEDYCALEARSDIDDAIREAERTLAAAKEQGTIAATREFEPFDLPVINVPEIEALLARGLPELDRQAAEEVQAHIRTLGERAEPWLAYGVAQIPERQSEGVPCPFCAQDLGGSALVAHYRAYFGTAYAAHKDSIATAINAFEDTHAGDAPLLFERAIRQASERRTFWSRFADVPVDIPDTAAINRPWASARDGILAALRAKQNAPLDSISLSQETRAALAAFNQARNDVAAVSGRLQQANQAIRLVKERAAAGNVAALQRDVDSLKAVKARFSPEMVQACAQYLALQNAKRAAEASRETARAALEQYRTTTFPSYQQATNEYLRKFNAGFRLDRIISQNVRGGSTCTYDVLINNRPVSISGTQAQPGTPSFRTALSAGDRNTLSLAFFFASLDQDPNIANKVVVIDDPISSLDEHRSLTTVQEVRRLMQRTSQVIVLSHNKSFLVSIWDGTDPTLRAALELARDGLGSTLRTWDVNRDMVTEHDRRHSLLRDYTAGATAGDREVAQSIRPILEAFVRVAYPEQFPPGALLGPFLNLCDQRVGTANLVLSQPDIDELRNLTEYANRFHHNTNPAWQTQHINDAELLDFVRRTLAFTRR